jgi:hypothetical protein
MASTYIRSKMQPPGVQTIDEKEECCICLEDMKNDITTMKCGHRIHKQCFNDFKNYTFENNKHLLCPLCRKTIKTNYCANVESEECIMLSLSAFRLLMCGITTYIGFSLY